MPRKRSNPNPLTISVIIVTSDRARLLDGCLASLESQTVAPIEIIIVDGSMRAHLTTSVVKRWIHRLPIILLKDTKHSIPYARDLGVKKSRGDIIVFLDDDLAASPNYLARMHTHFKKDPALDAVMGRIENRLPDNPYAATQFAYYVRGLRQHFPSMNAVQPVISGRMLDCEVTGIRRRLVTRLGFLWPRPAHFRHDDVELGLHLISIGATIRFDPHIRVGAYPRTALIPLWIAAYWNGYFDAYIEDHNDIRLRDCPYPSRFLSWLPKEIASKKTYRVGKKIFYGWLLISFPTISRIGKIHYFLSNIL